MADEKPDRKQLKCSFCGKTQEQVKKLIAGPGVYVCEECVALCNDILVEEGHAPMLPATADTVTVPRAELTSVVRTLDQAVGALGSGNARVVDEASRLAARLHRRLQAPSGGAGDDGPPPAGDGEAAGPGGG